MVRVEMAGQEVEDVLVPLPTNAPDRMDIEPAVATFGGQDHFSGIAGLPSQNLVERLPVDADRNCPAGRPGAVECSFEIESAQTPATRGFHEAVGSEADDSTCSQPQKSAHPQCMSQPSDVRQVVKTSDAYQAEVVVWPAQS